MPHGMGRKIMKAEEVSRQDCWHGHTGLLRAQYTHMPTQYPMP